VISTWTRSLENGIQITFYRGISIVTMKLFILFTMKTWKRYSSNFCMGATRRAKGIEAPYPLSQIKVKKISSYNFSRFFANNCIKILRAVHKKRPHKIAKDWPLHLSAKCPHWFKPPPPLVLSPSPHYIIYHKFRKFWSFFASKSTYDRIRRTPLSAKCPH